jgi:hypothetical protein
MVVAALFLLGTRDFKRMLAYSSVEHMGILTFAAALGKVGVFAALFHVWGNSLTKGALFLSAGNIRRAAGARTMDEVRGMSLLTPHSAAIFVTGCLSSRPARPSARSSANSSLSAPPSKPTTASPYPFSWAVCSSRFSVSRVSCSPSSTAARAPPPASPPSASPRPPA